MTRPTPGPWRIETVKVMSGFEERIFGPDKRIIGTVSRSGTGTVAVKQGAVVRRRAGQIPTEEDIANAQLITAAPDMRAALHRFAVKQHVRMVSGGGTIPNGGSCELCGTEWPEGQPEGHRAACLLARGR